MPRHHPEFAPQVPHGAEPADAAVTASVTRVTQQVLGMMPTPAGCTASAVSPSPGGFISAAEAFRRYGAEASGESGRRRRPAGHPYSAAATPREYGAEGGGGFSLPGALAARTHRTSSEAAA